MMHVVATAGHVDHGKSALVRALTGQEPDRFDEERRRGLTIDLGFVWTELAVDDRTLTVAFVDVPGHDRFLTNMLSGVGPVQEVLFVVAADDGWSAQSQEHLEIVALLGRRIVAAVVTKATPAGQERSSTVIADVRERLDRAGYDTSPVVLVDALDGTGLDRLRSTLVDRLHPPRPDDRFARVWVDRVFSVAGAGTVVTGALDSGRLERQQHLAVLPGGARGRIRELHALEQPVDHLEAPARVAVALAGVDSSEVARGDTLVDLRDDGRTGRTPSALATRELDVWLRTLPGTELEARGAWQLHLGSAHRDVRVLPLLGAIGPDQDGPARLRLEHPIHARAGDHVVLREVGRRRTVAGGIVLDPAPTQHPRGTDRRLYHAEALDTIRAAATPTARAAGLIEAHGGHEPLARLEAMLGQPLPTLGVVSPTAAASVDPGHDADGATPAGQAVLARLDDHVVRVDAAARWTAAVSEAAATADDPVLTRDACLQAARRAGCPAPLVEPLLAAAVADGLVRDVGGRLVHHERFPAYADGRDQRRARLLGALDAGALTAEPAAQVPDRHGLPWFEVQPLIDRGELFVRDGLLFPAAAIDVALARLDAGPAADGTPFTASQARQCWEIPRTVTMALLDQLRIAGHTRFDGQLHHRRGDAEH